MRWIDLLRWLDFGFGWLELEIVAYNHMRHADWYFGITRQLPDRQLRIVGHGRLYPWGGCSSPLLSGRRLALARIGYASGLFELGHIALDGRVVGSFLVLEFGSPSPLNSDYALGLEPLFDEKYSMLVFDCHCRSLQRVNTNNQVECWLVYMKWIHMTIGEFIRESNFNYITTHSYICVGFKAFYLRR